MKGLRTLLLILLYLFVLSNTDKLFSYNFPVAENAISSGTGGAFTAYLDDPEVLAYNPASFARIRQTILHVNYNQYLTGLEKETGLTTEEGYYPVNIYSYSLQGITSLGAMGAVGLSYQSFNYSELNQLSVFGVSMSLPLSTIVKFHREFAFGVTGKYLHNKYMVDDYNRAFLTEYSAESTGFAFDLGGYASLMLDLKLGLSIINILSTDMGIQYEDTMDTHYRIGIKYLFEKINFLGENKLVLLTDFDYSRLDYTLYTGAELEFIGTGIKLRTGINFLYLAFGAGYEYDSWVSVNYALNYYISGFDGLVLNHKMNLGVKF